MRFVNQYSLCYDVPRKHNEGYIRSLSDDAFLVLAGADIDPDIYHALTLRRAERVSGYSLASHRLAVKLPEPETPVE